MKKEEKEKSIIPFRGWLPKTPERKWYSNRALLISVTILLGSAVVMMWIYPYLSVTPAPPQTPTPPASPTISEEENSTITQEEVETQRPDEDEPITQDFVGNKTIRFEGDLEGEFVTNCWIEGPYTYCRANYWACPGKHVPGPPSLSTVGATWGEYEQTWIGRDFEMNLYEVNNKIGFGWWFGPDDVKNFRIIASGTYLLQDFHYHVTLQDVEIVEYFYGEEITYVSRWGPKEIQFSFTLRSSDVEGLLEDMN